MITNPKNLKNKVEKIIRQAGKIIKADFLNSEKYKDKGSSSNFSTRTDIKVERFLAKEFIKLTPKFSIYAEEENLNPHASQYRWIIDPIDGTHNFYLGIPYFSISVALMNSDSDVIMAFVHNPISDQFYFAEKSHGAYLNNKKIHVSNNDILSRANLAYSHSYETEVLHPVRMYLFNELHTRVERYMNNWSVALDYCLVAQGSIDIFIDNDCELWDRAAGYLIAKEAGAKITNFSGKTVKVINKDLITTNGTSLHNYMIKELEKVKNDK